jgi:hypothetical protein
MSLVDFTVVQIRRLFALSTLAGSQEHLSDTYREHGHDGFPLPPASDTIMSARGTAGRQI